MTAGLPHDPGARSFQADDRFVRALTRRLTGDPHLADDAAQETWLAALQQSAAPALFQELGRGWLCTVARNCVLQALRGRQRRLRREQAVAREQSVEGEAARAIDADLHARVLAALRDLPEDYRRVVHERFFEDRMPVEIADRAGLPVETVRTRLRRALERLRAAVTARNAPRRD